MTGKLSKNFHGVGIGPLSKIYAVLEELTNSHLQTNVIVLHIFVDMILMFGIGVQVKVGVTSVLELAIVEVMLKATSAKVETFFS